LLRDDAGFDQRVMYGLGHEANFQLPALEHLIGPHPASTPQAIFLGMYHVVMLGRKGNGRVAFVTPTFGNTFFFQKFIADISCASSPSFLWAFAP